MKCCPLGAGTMVFTYICALAPFAISLCFCIFYWIMWDKAIEYNDVVPELYGNNGEGVLGFDRCGASGTTDDFRLHEYNTHWTSLLELNAIVYLILTIFSALVCIGTCFPPITVCAGIGHTCGCLLQFATIIFTAVMRYNTWGKHCADNEYW